jgi:hypothetical protein
MNAQFDDAAARGTPLREQLVSLARDLRASLVARLEVAKVEVRASARQIIVGAVGVAAAVLFAMAAWFSICALAAYALASAAGLSWLTALLIVAVANIVLAAIALAVARRHLDQITLSHTRHAFLGRPHAADVMHVRPGSVAMPTSATHPDESTVQGIHHGAT